MRKTEDGIHRITNITGMALSLKRTFFVSELIRTTTPCWVWVAAWKDLSMDTLQPMIISIDVHTGTMHRRNRVSGSFTQQIEADAAPVSTQTLED